MATVSVQPPPARQSALALVYPKFNVLDITGPTEVFFNTGFSLSIAASDDLTTSQENITVQRSLSLADAKERLSDFDILVVPGSRSRNILPHLGPPLEGDGTLTEVIDMVRCFAKTPRREGRKERAVLAGPLGSYLLGAAGVLDGMVATTHRLVVGLLRHVCTESQRSGQQEKETEVVPHSMVAENYQLYVDAGCNEVGVRVITVTGPSAVIDATLYLMARWKERPLAEEAAMFLGHTWREIVPS